MNFVSRAQWGARPPTAQIASINSTVTTGHWEGPHMGNFPHESCATKVRGIQAYHMDNNRWSDIAYNGLACPHGYVYEGRGPQKRSAANGTNAANNQSAVICYVGGQGDPFTPEGQQAMADGAAWLGDPMQKGHRDWYNTQCPGDEIYNWIKGGVPGPSPTPPAPTVGAPSWPYYSDDYLGQPSPDSHCHSGFYGDPDNSVVRTWQTQMSNRGWSIGLDGKYGPQSQDVCRKFQAEKGLAADGLVGPQTWNASWTAPVT